MTADSTILITNEYIKEAYLVTQLELNMDLIETKVQQDSALLANGHDENHVGIPAGQKVK